MKKTLQIGTVITMALLLAVVFGDLSAQPPGMPVAPSQAPLDGGLSVLAIAGGAYALNKIRKSRKG